MKTSGTETIDKMDILADTNIVLRRIHRRDPQHRITQRCLNRLIKDGNRICVTSQNLIELWTVCTRPVDNNGLGLDTVHTDRILARVERSVVRLPDSDSVYPEWRRLVTAHCADEVEVVEDLCRLAEPGCAIRSRAGLDGPCHGPGHIGLEDR